MNATEFYEAGQLQSAIDSQIQEVKSSPGDASKRLFLFDLLSFAGDLDRAQRQIDAILTDDIQQQAAIQSYRRLLDAERIRRQVFDGKAIPKFLSPPPAHVDLRLEAVLHLAKGDAEKAVEALAKAAEITPALKGTANGEAFELFVDCDDVFGTVVEVMANGEYYWVPLEQIESIDVKEPKYPIDLLWRSASLETARSHGEVFLPVLYPGSHANPDDQVRLGRLTDWIAPEVGPIRGIGAHTYLADERDISILEWRNISIENGEPIDDAAEEGETAEPDAG